MGTPSERRMTSRGDVKLHSFDEVREREREFFEFLDSELDKVETFYKQKEDHAGQRLALLREQLHEMRNRRTHEIMESRRRKEQGESDANGHENGKEHEHHSLFDPLKAKLFKPGPNSRALQKMPQTPVFAGASREERRDYTRRPPESDIPYRTAKRKLKVALQEFYRGLELLKSYALLNRTAFRKLNKKYDKAVNARPPYRYMNEKVNKSWFVTSDILDGHIHAVEDLYARYFERGNHKLAAGKLRSLSRKPGDESGSAFVNGLLLGVGAVFTVQGLVYGAELLFDSDPIVRQQTSYLMQIYGGYFLMLYLFCLFCLDCKIWTCMRRYHDTKNVFPHLVNCGKYVATIITAVCLSLYRINGSHANLALFITFATINGVYTSFSEVTRRGMWTLFRVENEHCANVAQYKASRDVPLPYQIETLVERVSMESALDRIPTAASGKSTGVEISGGASSRVPTANLDSEEQGTPDDGTVRRRRADTVGRRSIARIMAEAHKQDFEKRRKPETPVPEADDEVDAGRSDDDDDDDDDDDETGSLLDERMEVREAEMLRKPTEEREDSN
ncbi:putative signal transduction protein [Phaeoacremonium minimum UCRPA7]|uniref:Putative signal transduction protein n=1 Tax=Phaeoacremonium minimum (strain UCR-PA7) TaxID=1286976 RepID=R8BHE5_PHAM7|nr:putative signal transduction protein [Phaeoacremonium minimum UCRPA7]EON98662.1 putative signal transduction protein [Phaeoacremonium minimum UCRPA7]